MGCSDPGCRVWVNTCGTKEVYIHELGHNMGMTHAASNLEEKVDTKTILYYIVVQLMKYRDMWKHMAIQLALWGIPGFVHLMSSHLMLFIGYVNFLFPLFNFQFT